SIRTGALHYDGHMTPVEKPPHPALSPRKRGTLHPALRRGDPGIRIRLIRLEHARDLRFHLQVVIHGRLRRVKDATCKLEEFIFPEPALFSAPFYVDSGIGL